MPESLSIADFNDGAQSIFRAATPQGYPSKDKRFFINSRQYWKSERIYQTRYILENGAIATVTIIELPAGYDTKSVDRSLFLQYTSSHNLLFTPVADLETDGNTTIDDIYFYNYLKQGYRLFDQHHRPLPWTLEDVFRLVSLRHPFTNTPIGAVMGNGSFISPGNHPASDAYVIMPLRDKDEVDYAVLVYKHAEGVWVPPGVFGSAQDKREGEYLPSETARRAVREKSRFDADRLSFTFVMRKPIISEFTSLHARIEVSSYLASIPYDKTIARNVVKELSESITGVQWVSVRTLFRSKHSMWQEHAHALVQSITQYQNGVSQPDVFLSFAGSDRPKATILASELSKRGIAVFTDNKIALNESINATITAKIATAKVFVAYYSKEFASRPACQQELLYAFTAGHIQGVDPTEHIIVLNPDDPYSSHIAPQELADKKYFIPTSENYAEIARYINKAVRTTESRIGHPAKGPTTTWYGNVVRPDTTNITPADLWRLHDALTLDMYRLTSDETPYPFILLTGPNPTRKTALVTKYGSEFGAAYPGGIYWINLTQAQDEIQALYMYESQLRRLIDFLELPSPHEAMNSDQLLVQLGAYFNTRSGKSLWVVDNTPSSIEFIHKIRIPSYQSKTVFITHNKDNKKSDLPLSAILSYT